MIQQVRKIGRQLLVPLLILTACLGWMLQENQELAQRRSELEFEYETFQADDDIGWAETTAIVDAVLANLDYRQHAPTQAEWHLLRRSRAYFNRRLQKQAVSAEDVTRRILDLTYMAHVTWKIRQFQETEQSLREMLDLLEQSGKPGDDLVDRQRLRIDALNWLSCLQTHYGSSEEALVTSRKAIELGQQYLDSSQGTTATRATLAMAMRNSGVIKELLEESGTSEVEQAATLITEIREQHSPDVDDGVHEWLSRQMFLVDSLQMAGFMHLRHNRRDAAMTAWQQASVACAELVNQADDFSRQQSDGIPQLRIRKAKARLNNDLALLQRLTRSSTDSTKPPDGKVPTHGSEEATPPLGSDEQAVQWSWTPLIPGSGLSQLAIDSLISGHLPGEFEPQEAILLSWIPLSWCRNTLLQMVAALQETTLVVLLVEDDEVRDDALDALREAQIPLDRVQFQTLSTNTIWTRDFGPTTVRCDDGAVRIARSLFVGGLSDMNDRSDFLPVAWSRTTGWPIFSLPVLVETGALLSNGDGLCLATTKLLMKNKASGIDEPQVTGALKRLTGATEVVYLQPLIGEPTEHVDWFATFTSRNTVVIGDYFGTDARNAEILDHNARRLAGIVTSDGPLVVERIPMPPRAENHFGGTYTNVVYANGTLLVPTWRESPPVLEQKALDTYRRLLPDWKIVPVDSYEFGRKEGSLHCATMNLFRYRPLLLQSGIDSDS